jgi:Tfp pilus assembly protein PilX
MKTVRNDKGVALVMVLVMALIGLAMVAAMVFMVTQSTILSGASRFYRTADEAGVGAAEMTAEYILNRGTMTVLNHVSGCNCGDPLNYADNIDVETGGHTCRCEKICNPTAQYNAFGAVCADEDAGTGGLQISVDPTTNFDGAVALGAFTVTYKIVDTIEGNTDPATIVGASDLVSSGVVATTGGVYSPPHFPYLYRVEVLAQRTANARERSRVSVLYGY